MEPIAVKPITVEPIAVEPITVEPIAVYPIAVEPPMQLHSVIRLLSLAKIYKTRRAYSYKC